MNEVIIAGAGLSGLTAAYKLRRAGVSATILEARSRTGGRIQTLEVPVEMGATWFGDQHIHLRQFLEELGIEHFEQFTQGNISYDLHEQAPVQYMEMPAGQPPSYRIKGGSSSLIEKLASNLDQKRLHLNSEVKSIHDSGESVLMSDQNGKQYQSRVAIVTLPPQLLAHSVTFEPALPVDTQELMANTHTWMGESVKFALRYARPFWKEKGLSGMGFTQTGIIQEVHDHTNFEESFFALKGFLRDGFSELSQTGREQLVRAQVMKLFGEEAADYLSYHDRSWINEVHTSVKEAELLIPHQNSGHPGLSQPLMADKVLVAGTETSPVYGGYMEGAVYAGMKAAQQTMQLLGLAQSN